MIVPFSIRVPMASQRGANSRLAFERRDYVEQPGTDAHAAWAAGSWPSVAAAFASLPQEAFYSHALSVDLAGTTVQFATGSARLLDRDAERISDDGNTMLVVGINFDGEIVGEVRRRALRVLPGYVLLLDLAQPCRLSIPSSRSVQLAIPRALAERHLGAVRRLHGRVIAPKTAALFVNTLRQLETMIPTLPVNQGQRVAGVLLDLLAIATRSDHAAVADLPDISSRRSAASIRASVESSVDLASLTVSSLCQSVGVSRSTLSRTFKADGGIETHIRNLRLGNVREALLDPDNTMSVRDLAERWGFNDGAHLSRAFRARYGAVPSAMRAAVAKRHLTR